MGGIGLSSTNLNRTPPTHVRTYIRTQIHTYAIIHLQTISCTDTDKHICSTCMTINNIRIFRYISKHNIRTQTHTEQTENKHTSTHRTQHNTTQSCTQYAHNLHTHNTENRNKRYKTMQHLNNTEHNTENITENSTENNAQTQHKCITDNLYIYSVDFYHEYVCIKDSNTIEFYTISK